MFVVSKYPVIVKLIQTPFCKLAQIQLFLFVVTIRAKISFKFIPFFCNLSRHCDQPVMMTTEQIATAEKNIAELLSKKVRT